MREKIALKCSVCSQKNYTTMKNKRNIPEKLVMSKYCKFCKKHTEHSETKIK